MSTSAEVLQEEFEVLESIFPDELESAYSFDNISSVEECTHRCSVLHIEVSDEELRILVEPEQEVSGQECSFMMMCNVAKSLKVLISRILHSLDMALRHIYSRLPRNPARSKIGAH
jgi:hypothetical protein